MTALPEYIKYWIVLSTQRIWWEEILPCQSNFLILSPSRSLCLSLSVVLDCPSPNTYTKHTHKRRQTHKKLCWECQCFLRASAQRETFTQVDMVDHQDGHRHTRMHTCTHTNTHLPCIYPCGGWAVDNLSWQSPLHLVFPLHPVPFFNSFSTSLPSIPCTTPITLFHCCSLWAEGIPC